MKPSDELDLLCQIATDIHAIKLRLVDEPDQRAHAEAEVIRKMNKAMRDQQNP